MGPSRIRADGDSSGDHAATSGRLTRNGLGRADTAGGQAKAAQNGWPWLRIETEQGVRLGLSGFDEPEAAIQDCGAVLMQRAKHNWNTTITGECDRGLEDRTADAATLEGRVDIELPDVHVVGPILDAHVAAWSAVVLDDLEVAAVPVVVEELILLGLVPRTELTLDDVADCGMVDSSSELGISRCCRSALDLRHVNTIAQCAAPQ